MRCSLNRLCCAAVLTTATFCSAPLLGATAPSSPLPATPALPLGSFGPAPLQFITAELRQWGRMRGMLSAGDRQRLDAANVRFDMQSQFSSDPELDPFYDRTRDTVRAGYIKAYREMLQRQYPLDDLVDEALAARQFGGAAPSGPSWRLRVSPRLAVGGNGYLGARLALPYTGISGLDRMNLNLRRGFFDDEWAVGVRYSDGPRFLQVERVIGDDESGERYTATVVLRF